MSANTPQWLAFARAIKATDRTAESDAVLATFLAGIAGAANAGGFILLGSYTSHMTGYLSQLADNIVLKNISLVIISTVAIGCFILGAACAAIVINWARHNRPAQQYALPIGIQGGLFLGLACLGALGQGNIATHISLGWLAFIMGFQNATITKISYARIRTTHATGMVTDVGIELGRAVYGRASGRGIAADRLKLAILVRLLAVFLIGGILGAVGYAAIGSAFSLPLAAVLLALALV